MLIARASACRFRRAGTKINMGRLRGRDGLLRGEPPYPWWQWVLVGTAWATIMFLIFYALSGFRFVVLNALIWPVAGAVFAAWTRQRIVARERRTGPRPGTKG